MSSANWQKVGTGLGVGLLALLCCVLLFFIKPFGSSKSWSHPRVPRQMAPRSAPTPYVVPPLPGPLPVASRYRSLSEVNHG